MKVSVLLQKIREYIIPKDAEIQVAAFNILALCGVIVSVITAIVNAASGHWPVVGADLSGVICSLALMIYCHRTGNYRRAMILTVFIVFLGLFTALYFIQGGYHSGIPAFFIFGVVVTAVSLFIYDHFIKWLTILNCILPPIGVVIIVDYFVNMGRYEEDERSLPSVNIRTNYGII